MQPGSESGYEQENTQQQEARRDPLGCRRLPRAARVGTVLRSQRQRICPQMRHGSQDPDNFRQSSGRRDSQDRGHAQALLPEELELDDGREETLLGRVREAGRYRRPNRAQSDAALHRSA